MKDELVTFAFEFYVHGKLPKAIIGSFIALVPKSDNAQSVGEFRPIFLVSSLDHLITKLLAARLKVVIGKLVAPSQITIIEGR